MIDMISNADSGVIATKKNPRELVFTKLELPPVVVSESPIRELPLFPSISRKALIGGCIKDVAAACRQSKCLKLYCDCFSSGVLCKESKDCDCADCHNNSDKSDFREAVMVNVLDRNPSAFNRKLPTFLIDKQNNKAATDTKLGLVPRGCKCKRTKCLKKHCECFQANVLCSDNCKCIDCANVSEGVQPSVVPWSPNNRNLLENYDKANNIYNVNAIGIISANRRFNNNDVADCMNYAPEYSAQSSLQVYGRRRYQELPEQWSSCPAPLSSMPDSSIINSLDSPMYSSPKLPYRKKRSRLGYTPKLIPDLGDISSLLLAASESATANAVNFPVLELQSGLQDQSRKPDGKEDKTGIELSNEFESGIAEEDIQSCGRLIELIDAQYNGEVDSTETSGHETDIYMEQERAVLETFRDCLHKYIKNGFMEGQLQALSLPMKQGNLKKS